MLPAAAAACSLVVIALAPFVAQAQTASLRRQTLVSTRFQVFVPPNNDQNGRWSSIVITALSGTAAAPTLVDLIDDGADGDTDDSVSGAALVKGASLVRYIRDGAVNDDAGGVWDGDYLRVAADKPVAVMLVTDSDWQHDWAPADNGTLRGTAFYLYANKTSVSNRDIDVFAYENGTRVQLYDITDVARTTSGITTVRAPGADPLMSTDLDEGEDLIVRRGLGRDVLVPGRTYLLMATKPVTCMFGAVGSLNPTNQARDGGGFVPGRNGEAQDTDFYFHIPTNPGALNEQELRVVAVDDGVTAVLSAFDETALRWTEVRRTTLNREDHFDYVGGPWRLYRLTSTGGRVIAYEANWLETGAVGTSDESDFAPGIYGAGGETFIAYVGPPGYETNTHSSIRGTFSHLYLYSFGAATGVRVTDSDTGGTIVNRTIDIPAGGFADVRIDQTTYNALNRSALGIRPYLTVRAGVPIAVQTTNWNDNWMAYAAAVLPANPVVNIDTPAETALGTATRIQGSVTNVEPAPLTNVGVTAALPSGYTFIAGTAAGAPPVGVSTGSDGTQVNFVVPAVAPGETVPVVLDVRPDTARGGTVAAVTLTAAGTGAGVVQAAGDSATTTIVDARLPTIEDLVAVSGDGVVTLRFSITGPAATWRVEAAVGSPTAPYDVIAGPTGFSGSTTPTAIEVPLASVINGRDYYLRVRAAIPDGRFTIAGPVVGQPRDTTPPPVPTIAVEAQDRTCVVTVGGSTVPDLRGYRVERSIAGGAFAAVAANPVSGPTVVDAGRTNGVPVGYRAQAVDTTGNASAWSAVVAATPVAPTSRAFSRTAAFEDMLGAGENDWDYNDFIVRTEAREALENGGLKTVVIDFEPLARGAGYTHALRLRLPVAGSWTATVVRFAAGDPGTQVEARTTSGVGTIDIAVYDDTRAALPDMSAQYANTPLSQAQWMPGATARIQVDLASPGLNTGNPLGDGPYDLYLKLPYMAGPNEIHLPGRGGATEYVGAGPLAGQNLDFGIVADSAFAAWPFEGQAVWIPFADFVSHVRQGTAPRWYAAASGPAFAVSRGR